MEEHYLLVSCYSHEDCKRITEKPEHQLALLKNKDHMKHFALNMAQLASIYEVKILYNDNDLVVVSGNKTKLNEIKNYVSGKYSARLELKADVHGFFSIVNESKQAQLPGPH